MRYENHICVNPCPPEIIYTAVLCLRLSICCKFGPQGLQLPRAIREIPFAKSTSP